MSSQDNQNKPWVPEIMYEEDENGMSSHIPFIHVPLTEEMPKMLFMFESRDTGEVEPGPNGEDLPVTELDLYQYANMNYLKTKLSTTEYDNVRFALGLESMKAASVKGQHITSNVKVSVDNVSDAVAAAIHTRE